MGSCVSVHKDPESVMKLRFSFGTKNDKLLIPSPVKDKIDAVNVGDRTAADVAPARFRDAGSKDEAFFDSQPWLESDCEDDFFSVNGDLTPSRGSTPLHHNFSLGNLQVKKPSIEGATGFIPEPSPPDKKKRLSELFKESLREHVDEETNQNEAAAKSSNKSPYYSRANSGGSCERTPYRVPGDEDKLSRSPQCCLPKLLSSGSFSERKRRSSPVQKVG